MARFTVLGASGFLGSHLCRYLRARGEDVLTPDCRRGLPQEHCGQLVYCIGITGDFRGRPFETMHAHVGLLGEALRGCAYDTFLYLSSTRVYAGAESGAEDAPLAVAPTAAGDLYNLSKLAGEALCLAHPSPGVRVARLSNLFATDRDVLRRSPDFVPSLVRAAVDERRIVLETAPGSRKDYLWAGDAVRALHRIAVAGTHRLYNVASGRQVSHRQIADALRNATGCAVEVRPGARRTDFPPIDVSRLRALFPPAGEPWAPADLVDALPDIAACYAGAPEAELEGADA